LTHFFFHQDKITFIKKYSLVYKVWIIELTGKHKVCGKTKRWNTAEGLKTGILQGGQIDSPNLSPTF